MCFTLFRKHYYYKVSHYDDNRIFYIMCSKCYKKLPKHLQMKHCNPDKEKFHFKFDEEGLLVEELLLLKNQNCLECKELNNNDNFYETVNRAIGLK